MGYSVNLCGNTLQKGLISKHYLML